MKIDDDYGLVASIDELNTYRRLDRQQQYNTKHKKASKHKSNTDKRKDAFYDDRKSVTWVKVAQQFHISESTAKAWRSEVKHILGAVL